MIDLSDLTAEQLNPQPPVWPQCDTCSTDYVLRRAFSLTKGTWSWAWMRDCEKPRSTCKNAKAVLVSADGPVEMSDDG